MEGLLPWVKGLWFQKARSEAELYLKNYVWDKFMTYRHLFFWKVACIHICLYLGSTEQLQPRKWPPTNAGHVPHHCIPRWAYCFLGKDRLTFPLGKPKLVGRVALILNLWCKNNSSCTFHSPKIMHIPKSQIFLHGM